MGVSEPRYSVHHAYGVVQVQVDLQVGQWPSETFFQIRGEERMEKVPWRTRRKKDEARSLTQGGGVWGEREWGWMSERDEKVEAIANSLC